VDEGGALSLVRSAELYGGYRWIEQRIFELTGAWAAEPEIPEIQIHLDEVSAEHAWHAELFFDRLPVLDWVNPDELTVPVGPAVGPLFDALAGPSFASPVVRLGVLSRVVLPRLVTTYERHLGRARPVADAPAMRVLKLVLADERAAAATGTALVAKAAGALGDAAQLEACERLESVVVNSGVGEGLVPWPNQ
jgi:hypothetical protein